MSSYYKVTVIKSICSWQKNRQIDKESKPDRPYVDPHRYSQVIYDKDDVKKIQCKNSSIFNKWC